MHGRVCVRARVRVRESALLLSLPTQASLAAAAPAAAERPWTLLAAASGVAGAANKKFEFELTN